jgi:GTP-binding protein HflX
VLAEIDADRVPELLVVNKSDVADPKRVAELVAGHPDAMAVSAATGEGVDELLRVVAARLRALVPIVELVVPYDRGDVIAALHREGEVLVEVHDARGARVRARLPRVDLTRFDEFLVEPPSRGARES